ncbi:PilZ domain-containing protein [Novosphingobium cyanobacteriorum]|uniref:PilZ domain-containing protein n=1 Tax=Novosphingobium cyanobacteriorum TaxID=3024215 RepID=A0ABT6CJB5_9SPHN|nr:PilZ domain-containing protein [Novosphingobium cyanobacteriorum]MDF8333901.1 PilZ domain-containing protein [Novosphingobium cyanobacteriorum]
MSTTWRDSRFGPGSYEHSSQEDRCAPRSKVNIPATLRGSGAKGFHTVVNDLSLGGFCATALNRMHVGSHCWLTLPGLESLQATVIWWQNGQVGCAFSQLLSPIVHDNILARYRGDGVFRPVC